MAASMGWGFWRSQDPALCSHLYMQGAAWFETLCGCAACIRPSLQKRDLLGATESSMRCL